jgi:selenocysteine-specific elongation factor
VLTGEGIATLREALQQGASRAAARHAPDSAAAPFRLAIDRAFTMAGHGTVVTGSISSGRTQVGDALQIEPGGIAVRVRGLQNHDAPADEVHRGQRAAINLVGVHHESIRRGQELSTPDHLRPSRLLTVRVRATDSLARPIKQRSRVRVHIGTAEVLASLVLLDRDSLAAQQTCLAQLHLAEPAATTWRQPFVIRRESPLQTIGGGHVLVPAATRLRHVDPPVSDHLAALERDALAERAAAALYFAGLGDWQPADLARTAGISDYAGVVEQLAEAGTLCEVALSPSRTLRFHHGHLHQLGLRIEQRLAKLHQQHPLQPAIDLQQLRQPFAHVDDAVFHRALAELATSGRVQRHQNRVALAGHGPQLSANERKLLAQLVDDYRHAGFESPSVSEMQQRATRNQAAVPQLVALAAAQGDLVAVTPQYYLHIDVDRAIRQQLAAALTASAGLTVSEIREILRTSRKYAVPYCEYLDRIGFTRRDGDRRSLADSADHAQRT